MLLTEIVFGHKGSFSFVNYNNIHSGANYRIWTPFHKLTMGLLQ